MSLLPSILALSLLMGVPGESSSADAKDRVRAQPKTNVAPKPKDHPDGVDSNGRLMIGVHAGGMPRFRVGGEWSRTKPFFCVVPFGEFLFVRVECFRPPAAWDGSER